ncbi:hypothetical protein [Actinoplanes subtropicus]|uniref:hypothetical protein n=1 Tax=Actinoplanes subtropicus TaxID=543632 RepID=UPI00068B6755|nr:hypothetical protein [Actinoplanes subtropicus]
MRSLLRYEMRLWLALYRWVFRRPEPLPPGSVPFSYSGSGTMLLTAFIVVSAIEIPILDLLLPWRTARIIALVAGVYGLLWMIGLMATIRVLPHVVGEPGVRIRKSIALDLTVGWDNIREIRSRGRSLPPGGQTRFEDGVLSYAVAGGTTVDLVLAEPITLPDRRTGGEPVREIRFHADRADDLVAAARTRLTARA